MLSSTRWSIVHAARQGDLAALTRLCEKYRPAIVGYLRRRGVEADAEDLAQEALLALVEYLPRLEQSAGRFRSLVFAVSRNKLMAHRARAGAMKRGGNLARAALSPDELASETPDDLFDMEWIGSLLHRALGRLEEKHPSLYGALQGTVLTGKPQAEAARGEGISAGAMRKRVWRARQQIALYLRDEISVYGASREDVATEVSFLARLLGPELRADEEP